jgi:hypothetical protein
VGLLLQGRHIGRQLDQQVQTSLEHSKELVIPPKLRRQCFYLANGIAEQFQYHSKGRKQYNHHLGCPASLTLPCFSTLQRVERIAIGRRQAYACTNPHFSILARVEGIATRKRARPVPALSAFQYPTTGRRNCNALQGRARGTGRTAVSVPYHGSKELQLRSYNLTPGSISRHVSVPYHGSKELQHRCVAARQCPRYDMFQYPTTGRRNCNRDTLAHGIRRLLFQYPTTGRRNCNMLVSFPPLRCHGVSVPYHGSKELQTGVA